jgi:type I restriction enzyme S subunit
MKWTFETLSELCDINLGNTPSRNVSDFWGKGYEWVSISDLKAKYISKTKEQITDLAIEQTRAKIVKKGTLLMSFKLSIGKLAFAQKDLFTNEAIVALPIKDATRLYCDYLYYVLKYIPLVGGNQAAMGKTLNKQSLSALRIPLPPTLDDQKRISKILSQSEDLIQVRRNSIILLDDLLRSTFLDMFGDPVSNEKGWKIVPLSKFGSIDRGVSKHRPRNAKELLNGTHPLVQTGDIANAGTYILDYKQTYSDIGLKQSKKWPTGTLCITIAANIAKTGILTFDACFPDSVVGFVVDPNEATNLYVHHLFSFFQMILEKNAPSAAQKNINLEILRTFKVPQPPVEVQKEFDKIALKVESLKKQYSQSLEELTKLYASLSKDAFTGKLNLNRIDISDMIDKNEEELEDENDEIVDHDLDTIINSFEHVLPQGEVPTNREQDIRGLSIRQYLGYPEYDDATEGVEFGFMNKDFFYQFILKDGFTDRNFTLAELEKYARKYILRGSGYEFTYENWKYIVFRFLDAKQPILEQILAEFMEDEKLTKSIKLKLTDEAFKV